MIVGRLLTSKSSQGTMPASPGFSFLMVPGNKKASFPGDVQIWLCPLDSSMSFPAYRKNAISESGHSQLCRVGNFLAIMLVTKIVILLEEIALATSYVFRLSTATILKLCNSLPAHSHSFVFIPSHTWKASTLIPALLCYCLSKGSCKIY